MFENFSLFGFARVVGIVASLVLAIATAALWAMQDRFLFLPVAEAAVPTHPEVTEHIIETSDGEKLVVWYVPAPEGCPTLLQFHGNGGHLGTELWRHKRLLDAGVGFLALSWRGYAGSSGSPSEKGLHKDARAAWDWLIARDILAENIVIQAHSIGSGPATRLAADVTPGALILEAPFYSMKDLVGRKIPALPTGLLLRHPFRSDLHMGKIESPLLIVHGTEDSLIPIEQSERLFELANDPKTYVSMLGSDHNTLVRDGLYDHVWPFLTAHWTPSNPATDNSRCLFTFQTEEQSE